MPGKLKVVLCWHMHQPQYRDPLTETYRLPWSYLHIIKDYVDMAAHLEAEEGGRAVVNFAPVLIEQIDDYGQQIKGFLENAVPITDPVLAALADASFIRTEQQRKMLLEQCLKANEKHLIARFVPFKELTDIARHALQQGAHHQSYLSHQYFRDLLIWYHLAWMGETVRREDERVTQLMEKQYGYTQDDSRLLLTLISELCHSVIPRYRRLAESGRVELAMTPYGHPIVPLLLDIHSAKEAMPDAALPEIQNYPGGRDRAAWHIQHGKAVFESHFGFVPQGCWPSEGSISSEAVALFAEHGYKWVASGESVFKNSVERHGLEHEGQNVTVHRPYGLGDQPVSIFFRDDGLSDLIGFNYSDWHADDAVANLIHHLQTIAANAGDEVGNHVVSIILDGENAWEYYPENAYYFLSTLYRQLSQHADLELTTFSEVLNATESQPQLSGLVAGSWVYGTFSTWIGDAAKNRGWDILSEAKRVYDEVIVSLSPEQKAVAEKQLAVCEGSDWCWWFGDYNPASSVSDFEQLYRHHVGRLYQILGVEAPEYLLQSFTQGSGEPAQGGVMRRGQEI